MICYLDSRHRSQQQLVEQLERMEETREQRQAAEAEAQRELRRQEAGRAVSEDGKGQKRSEKHEKVG